ncbi:TolB family protein [Deinococcus hopiensis]|uniref:WD40-like Beta Propeller Repeat n=1 Tax=Deinococcus hopiensis KR-140 TaxID=695939 RepID=A0A1W1VU80_9DEIO|nr:PD40 domain-containing protein [Deinococcus hopiensis]SMB96925.1 WD40-like Beta Propeller Repeat [Deinococcus hopiensis KR-140]
MNRLALALLLLTTASAAPALPQGKLAYLRGFAPWLESRVGALPRELPHSGDVYRLALSPATGDVAYAEATAGRNSPGLPPMRGLLLPPPYAAPQPLPARWRSAPAEWLSWSEAGYTLWAGNADGLLLNWTAPGRAAAPSPDASSSRDGRALAWASGNGVVTAVNGAGERAIFTTGRPQVLLDALGAQRRWPQVASFLRGYNPALARDRGNWRFSLPAVSPDGQAVYFAANLGQGDEDLRNNFTFFVFRFGLRSGGLLALGKFGGHYGETPTLRVSPDGRTLLFVQEAYESAPQQPVTVTALNLATQTARDLTATDRGRGDLNRLDGFCWLPDSRHVAYSVASYRSEDAFREGFELGPGDYTLYVKDVVTGKAVHTVAGATQPGCGPR